MKKLISLVLVVAMVMALMTGCTSPMAQYQDDVKEAELIEAMEDIMDEKADIDDLLDDMDFDNIVPEDMVSGFDSSEMDAASSQVEDFLDEIDSVLEALEDIEAGDDEVEALHDNMTEALEGFKEIYGAVPLMMNYLKAVGGSFDLVMEKAMAVETDLTPYLMGMSEAFSLDFIANQGAIELAMANLEGVDFGDMETEEDIQRIMSESTEIVTDINATIELVEGFSTENDADEAIQVIFVELLQSLVDMIDVAFADPSTMKVLQEFAGESDQIDEDMDEYEGYVDDWMDDVKED